MVGPIYCRHWRQQTVVRSKDRIAGDTASPPLLT